MAHLTCGVSLGTIILDGKRFALWNEERWEEVQAILKEFGITFPSKSEVIFQGKAYGLLPIPRHFGAQDIKVFYKGSVIAKATVEGCHVGDREGVLTVYLDTLRSIYEPL